MKRCPFCRGETNLHRSEHPEASHITYILCDSCGLICSFRGSESEEAAMECWKQRWIGDFHSKEDLIKLLDGLHVMDETGAVTNQKWDLAQQALAAIVKPKPQAPWPDFAGNPIHDRDRIRHPDGVMGTVLYLPALGEGGEAWRVVYDAGNYLSRLSLQVGDRGQAVVTKGSDNGNS